MPAVSFDLRDSPMSRCSTGRAAITNPQYPAKKGNAIPSGCRATWLSPQFRTTIFFCFFFLIFLSHMFALYISTLQEFPFPCVLSLIP